MPNVLAVPNNDPKMATYAHVCHESVMNECVCDQTWNINGKRNIVEKEVCLNAQISVI